ncbi:MAG: hypothetical protein R3C05_08705 [Pirellulaceae bacterium]
MTVYMGANFGRATAPKLALCWLRTSRPEAKVLRSTKLWSSAIMLPAADDGTSGYELWKSDGSEAGTVMVKDINPFGDGVDGLIIDGVSHIDGTLYFSATDGVNGVELWKSDGTETGTVLVKDIFPGGDESFPSNLTIVGDELYFNADDGVHGHELWKSDGTEAGTELVKDLFPGNDDGDPEYLVNFNGTLYFSGRNGINGHELWKSDGTAAGTVEPKTFMLAVSAPIPVY